MASSGHRDLDNQPVLNALRQSTQSMPAERVLFPEELSYLFTAFVPSQPAATRSNAYLALSAFCQGVRNSQSDQGQRPDPATETLVRVFSPHIASHLGDTDESSLLIGLSFLTALFQVDRESAASIFQQDGVVDFIMDSVDLTPSAQLCQEVARLLGQACGHKSCRANLTAQVITWLESTFRLATDMTLRSAAAVALIKLKRGISDDKQASPGLEVLTSNQSDESLVDATRDIVIGGDEHASIADAIEGLAYLTVDPTTKETLSKDTTFIHRLVALSPRRGTPSTIQDVSGPNSSLLYGILVIINNLCTYRTRLTEEQAQIEKLRRMARAGQSSSEQEDTSALDDHSAVKARIRRLVTGGVLEAVASAVHALDSPGIRVITGRLLLHIIEDQENRGKVLQCGGGKLLALIIRQSTPSAPTIPARSSVADSAALEPTQALAKLSITASPVQVFGPNDGAIFDMIRPFSEMLQHPSSTLLQRFEALMALTNLASHSGETSSRIARANGLMHKVDLLLLEEHELIRRAATELLCNLINGSDDVFDRYGGGSQNNSNSKLQILVALSDVEDLPTRLAASGALATLTSSTRACQALVALQEERHRVLPTLAQLIDPQAATSGTTDEVANAGLQLRALVCIRNVFRNIQGTEKFSQLSREAQEAGLVTGLTSIVEAGDANEVLFVPAVDCLKAVLHNNLLNEGSP